MTLIRAEPSLQRFPDGSAAARVRLLFDGGRQKTVCVTQCARGVSDSVSRLKQEAAYQVVKAVKEARRDALYAAHGADWISHERPFAMSADEEQVAQQAIELMTT